MKTGVFSSAYLAPLTYYKALLSCDRVLLEKHDSWQKQTYRNRCYIDGPNGVLMLNFPVSHHEKTTTETIQISDSEKWQSRHWEAIKTSYGSSPFFEVLGPELEPFYHKEYSSLFNWNLDLLKLTLDWLQVSLEIDYTQEWYDKYDNDYREVFHPKKPIDVDLRPYPQVFEAKNGFLPNLSILDLMFNEGPAAYSYLTQV